MWATQYRTTSSLSITVSSLFPSLLLWGSSTPKAKKSVSFGQVDVREYERVLASRDPDCPFGLTLGWDFSQRDPLSLDTTEVEGYESCRTTVADRFTILLNYGFSLQEMKDVETGDKVQKEYRPPTLRKRGKKFIAKVGRNVFRIGRL